MTTRCLSALLIAIGATAQSVAPEPSAGEIAARLTANTLKSDVVFLASDALEGRGTPSRGLEIAAEFIAAQFLRAGLEPAGDDGYFQTAAYASVTPQTTGLKLSVESGEQTVEVPAASITVQEAAALDLAHVPVLRVSAADVPALDAFTEDRVKGKALVLDSSDSPPAAAFAFNRRLPALAKLHPAAIIVLRQNAQAAIPRLREAAAPVVPILAVSDPKLREAAAGPDVALSVHIPAPTVTPVKLRNVIGILRGSDPTLKDTYVLLTAHYDHLGIRGTGEGDHIYNGANDDASGTASVLEIAHTLAASPRPRRTMVFIALFGEELGLVGSRYYAAHPVFPLAKTTADLNLEQLGRTDDNTGPRVGLVNVTGFDYTTLTAALQQTGQEFGIQVVKDDASSDSFFARSDNQAFADAGVPSHTLSVGYVFPDYHRPGDEWQKIDYENLAKIDRAVALMLWRVANSVEEPHWNSDNPKTERYVKARSGR